jgi:hypothetical protein
LPVRIDACKDHNTLYAREPDSEYLKIPTPAASCGLPEDLHDGGHWRATRSFTIHCNSITFVPVKVDEASLRDIPGGKEVCQKDLLGIVAETEWDAIRAAEKLKVEWSTASPAFPGTAGIYDHIRKVTVRKREVGCNIGNIDEAFKNAVQVIEAE